MSEDKTATKAASALSAAGQIVSVLKEAFVAFLLMALEYAKIKQKATENKLKNLENDNEIKKVCNELDKKNKGKSSSDIINEFLSK